MLPGFLLLSLTLRFSAAGPRCYECSDMSSPLECGYLTTCSDNQECYVDQIVSSGGLILYNSGCRSKQRCAASGKRSLLLSNKIFDKQSIMPGALKRQTTDLVTCSQCCQGEFCNEQGCGVSAPLSSQRGPNCFKCTDMVHPSECRHAVTCELGQLCMVYEVSRSGRTLYDSQCENQRVCQVISSLPQPIGRRRQVSNQLSCHACCSGDFCNDRCNTTVATTTLAMKTATPTVLTSSTILSTTSFLPSATSMKATSTRATTSQSSSSSRSTLTSISSILPSTSTVSAADKCKTNGYSYVPFLKFCFKFSQIGQTWDLANTACMKDGGTLAIIDAKPKWDFLKAILAQESQYANKYIWLGARDVNKNNTYYWVNGAPMTFNDWRLGHPDGVPSGAGGNCISSLGADNFHWHDLPCVTVNLFICTKTI